MQSVCNNFSAAPDRPAVVRLLIDSGANINARNNGWTALNSAEGCKYTEIVQILQQAGAQ
jgi:ankyrin repeat protein